jgi:mannan endo-1,4-beta-mannosidase
LPGEGKRADQSDPGVGFAGLEPGFAAHDTGDHYWDLFAFDIYGSGHEQGWYDYIVPIVGNKPMAIGECEKLPTPGLWKAQPRWCFFMSRAELTFRKNSDQQIIDLHQTPSVITREQLPKFK